MAGAAGIQLAASDFAEISEAVPLLAKVYPNGLADVNHFHAAGGLAFLIGELLDTGLLHDDVRTVVGDGLSRYAIEPRLSDGCLVWENKVDQSENEQILRPVSNPFAATGGLKRLGGNLGQGIMKISAVKDEHTVIEAPARVFSCQDEVKGAFSKGELNMDCIVVVRNQGPKANGMPELHGLTPMLSVLLDRGYKVGMVTDGRMSGASGKVPAAIHVSPEAASGGPLAKVEDGDLILLDGRNGRIEAVNVDLAARQKEMLAQPTGDLTTGQPMFELFRRNVGDADHGASVLIQGS